jgi:hypothetical protein
MGRTINLGYVPRDMSEDDLTENGRAIFDALVSKLPSKQTPINVNV